LNKSVTKSSGVSSLYQIQTYSNQSVFMKITSSRASGFVILAVLQFVSINFSQSNPLNPSSKISVVSPKFTNNDPVLEKIWAEGIEKSQLYPLAQTLLDSIGPRLTGSVEQKQSIDWALGLYRKWDIPVRAERYGTWMNWRRGIAHIDLIAPRIHSLEGMLSTWSPGTKGTIEGQVILFPNVKNATEFEASLPQMRGKFVLLSLPWASCRPDASWKEYARPESFERMQKERDAAFKAWYVDRVRASGLRGTALISRLEEAGALGIVTLLVPPPGPQAWGVSKSSTTISQKIPELGLGCEDYGLVFRLAENNQGPVLRVNAPAEFVGEVPVSNVIAELPGKEKADEYVILSAHFDSWEAGSGATDNGSGTVMMMEAMRILKAVRPTPKRTILAAHWSGEEQGLNGSGAFAADHPEIVNGLQILINQDGGTGRINKISMQGFGGAADFFRRWFSQMPNEITQAITLIDPGEPKSGSDNAAFLCYGVPAFGLSSVGWDYENYTWHTNRDTFDKLVFDDLKNNAVLVAMLAYLASEDSQRIPRELRITPIDTRTGQPLPWPKCSLPARNWSQRRN
jgi:carboxypeptidase Q